MNTDLEKPVVQSLAAQHNGQKFLINEGAILLGRDEKACQITYKDGTQGISKRHCALTWDAEQNAFLLMDLDSSYGTFLEDGTKLEPRKAYRLKPGGRFYLGERTNEILLGVSKSEECRQKPDRKSADIVAKRDSSNEVPKQEKKESRVKCSVTSFQSNFRLVGDGAIEYIDGEFVLYNKDPMVRVLFGAIGNAIASGKEFKRFRTEDIQSFEIIEKAFTNRLKITLKIGEYFSLKNESDIQRGILPILLNKVPQM